MNMNAIVKGIGFYSAVLGASSLLPLTRPSPSFVFVPSCCNVASLVETGCCRCCCCCGGGGSASLLLLLLLLMLLLLDLFLPFLPHLHPCGGGTGFTSPHLTSPPTRHYSFVTSNDTTPNTHIALYSTTQSILTTCIIIGNKQVSISSCCSYHTNNVK